jgi:hypothetical protein
MKANATQFCRFGYGAARALLAGALMLCALDASAALTHRYSFANDVSDSVGGANGTIQGNVVVGGGIASFAGAANTDYLELPSGLISNYTTVTFEMWVDVGVNGTWEELYAFGNQNASGAGANMVMFTPHSGSNPNDFRMSYAQADPGYNDEHVVTGNGVLDSLGPMSITCVYDPPNNSMSLYTNGVLVGSLSPVTTGAKVFSLTNVYNVHSWLGRSLYNADAPFTGSIDEFRIYNEPLGPLKVYVNNVAGPNTLVTNEIVVNSITWNVSTNMVVSTRQDTTVTFNTAVYGTVTLPGATEAIYSTSDPSVLRVNANGQVFAKALGSATVSAAFNGKTNSVLVTVATTPQLVHRYSFTSDASDSVGGANGTLVGNAKISGGAVVLPGDVPSNDPSVSYVDLPNNLVAKLTAITVEAWVTDNGSANWARVWDLGNSVGGENVSDTGNRFMYLSLPSGNNNGDLTGDIHVNDRGGDNALEWVGQRPPANQPAHIVWATDIANLQGRLFVNGALVAVNNNMFVTPADIGPSVNDWLGRSQYGDPSFNGSIDEFRIYNGALSTLQIVLDAAAGPDKIVTDPGALQSLQISISTNTIYNDGTPFRAALMANYASLNNVNVTALPGASFQTSDPTVAAIGSDGVVTGVGPGNAVLTGSYGGKTATFNVTVTTTPGFVEATLLHRYSFSDAVGSTVAKDSVGTADGVIKGVGAAFDGKGQLSLPGGNNSDADPSVIAGYVDLPNHIINVLTNLSIETWVTWQGSGSWQRIFDFGTSAGGEDISSGNGGYLFLTTAGSVNMRFSPRDPITASEPAPLTAAAPLATGQEVYLAVTYDFTHNSAKLYSNAVVVAFGAAPVDITTIDDVNNWLGRSQWADPMFQGKYDEFRIWNGVLLPGEISSHYVAGPDSLTPTAAAGPKLSVALSGNNVLISWPASTTGFTLQSSATLGASASWADVSPAPTGNSYTVTPTAQAQQYFRLRQGGAALADCTNTTTFNTWVNKAFANQTGTFTALFDATPSAGAPLDCVMALSSGAQTAFSGFACLVRFGTSGLIEARNGGAYAAENSISFSANVTYSFRFVVNVPAHTYSVYVTPAGGTEQTVGTNYAFRTEQNAVTNLNNMGFIVDVSSGVSASDVGTVCNFRIQ